MGFADSLVSLARTSPRVYDRNASSVGSKYHVSVETEAPELSGLAALDEMREVRERIEESSQEVADATPRHVCCEVGKCLS